VLFLTAGTLHAQAVPSNTGPSAATMPRALQNVGFEPPLNGPMPLDLHSATKPAAASDSAIISGSKSPWSSLSFITVAPCFAIRSNRASSASCACSPSIPAATTKSFLSASTPARRRRWLRKRKKKALAHFRRPETDSGWHFLTGAKESVEAATKAANFRFSFDAKNNLFATRLA